LIGVWTQNIYWLFDTIVNPVVALVATVPVLKILRRITAQAQYYLKQTDRRNTVVAVCALRKNLPPLIDVIPALA
jgi:hypothetical protein